MEAGQLSRREILILSLTYLLILIEQHFLVLEGFVKVQKKALDKFMEKSYYAILEMVDTSSTSTDGSILPLLKTDKVFSKP